MERVREQTTEQWHTLHSLSELCVIYTIKANANTSPMTWTHLKGFKNNQNVMLHSCNSRRLINGTNPHNRRGKINRLPLNNLCVQFYHHLDHCWADFNARFRTVLLICYLTQWTLLVFHIHGVSLVQTIYTVWYHTWSLW